MKPETEKLLAEKSCPLPSKGVGSRVLTRIFVQEDGDLVVTDMWDEFRALLECERPPLLPMARG